jgi:uncharacterized membrane protein
MTPSFTSYIFILVALLAADAVWLTLRADYHRRLFAAVQGGAPLEVRLLPAAGVYLVLAAALLFAALRDANSVKDAARRGALVGAAMYAFYDLTNYATLKNYTLAMTVGDIVWGTALCAGVSAATYAYFKAA